LGVALKIASFCESLTAMSAFICFRQLCDVFYDEGVPFINFDCQNVCQLGQRDSSVRPYHFSVFSALTLVDTYSEPI